MTFILVGGGVNRAPPWAFYMKFVADGRRVDIASLASFWLHILLPYLDRACLLAERSLEEPHGHRVYRS